MCSCCIGHTLRCEATIYLNFVFIKKKITTSQYHKSHNVLKVIHHPLYSMNKFVTNKSKLPQDGAQVFPYMG